MDLQTFFQRNPRVALALSGGVDSGYLLYAAAKAGAEIGAYYIKTAFQPAFELEDAKAGCRELKVALTVLNVDIMAEAEVVKNNEKRCYYCKRALFGALAARAYADGYPILIDGTNASDDISDRPGFRVLQEFSILSPLKECGLTKATIRNLAKEAGLLSWNKPAYACLATRVQDSPLTQKDLQRVERAEEIITALGYSDFRIRTTGNEGLLQVVTSQYRQALEDQEEINEKLAPLFADGVKLDPKTRKEEIY